MCSTYPPATLHILTKPSPPASCTVIHSFSLISRFAGIQLVNFVEGRSKIILIETSVDNGLPSWSWMGWHGEPLFLLDVESDGRGSYEVGFTKTVTQW